MNTCLATGKNLSSTTTKPNVTMITQQAIFRCIYATTFDQAAHPIYYFLGKSLMYNWNGSVLSSQLISVLCKWYLEHQFYLNTTSPLYPVIIVCMDDFLTRIVTATGVSHSNFNIGFGGAVECVFNTKNGADWGPVPCPDPFDHIQRYHNYTVYCRLSPR